MRDFTLACQKGLPILKKVVTHLNNKMETINLDDNIPEFRYNWFYKFSSYTHRDVRVICCEIRLYFKDDGLRKIPAEVNFNFINIIKEIYQLAYWIETSSPGNTRKSGLARVLVICFWIDWILCLYKENEWK